jgi:hypothetical protein
VMNRLVALVFEGGMRQGRINGWVGRAREELALSLCRKLVLSEAFDDVTLITDNSLLDDRAAAIDGVSIELDPYCEDYHFGARLGQALGSRSGHGFIYMGGGSGFFMTIPEIVQFAEMVRNNPGAIVSNNPFSADMFGSSDSGAIARLDLPPNDNAVPMVAGAAGMRMLALASSIGSAFDVDTPSDLLVLASAIPLLAPGERAVLDVIGSGPVEPALDRLRRARDVLATELSEVALIGRVSPATVMELNSRTHCRLRVFSEERSMRAFGRDVPGGARSLIGRHVEATGPEAFFDDLAWCCDAAFIDTRVLFSHMGAALSQEERFASDLGLHDRIENVAVARFVKAACKARLPVVLGGHSLVSGGVRVLATAEHSAQSDVV